MLPIFYCDRSLSLSNLVLGVEEGDELVVDGGMAMFEVIEKISNGLRCKCTDPGLLLPRAKLSFWRNGKLVDKHYELPTISAKVRYIVSNCEMTIVLSL